MTANIRARDLLWLTPLMLGMGWLLANIQPGSLWLGWVGFSFLGLITASALLWAARWAEGGKLFISIVLLAFALRLAGGVATYLILPINGYADEPDDSAGFIYTDAHRRDRQAWQLANSSTPIFSAFNKSYAYDQYGGLLALSALIYRYLSPDAHRPLMLVMLAAAIAALGLPFLWKSVNKQWGEKTAFATAWVYALYPESLLLGGAAMREPFLMAFSAFALWGFLALTQRDAHNDTWRDATWLALGIVGMFLVSPIAGLMTLVILGGWLYFTHAEKSIPWWSVALAALVFIIGLLALSAALNRSGEFSSSSPLHVIGDWLKLAVQWDAYQLERGSGWVQKLFDEMPEWLRLPFVMLYGIFQPVLPAALVEPTTATWRVIGILRAAGWYALLPVLAISFFAAWHLPKRERDLWLWLSVVVWAWILLTALRGGGDQWDNPRYRAILFTWQAILAGLVWVWQHETRSHWFWRAIGMELVFLLVFGQWYASRYYHLLGQLPFPYMVTLILLAWGGIIWLGVRRDAHAINEFPNPNFPVQERKK